MGEADTTEKHAMSIWLLIVLSVASMLTWYLGWRLINPAPLSRGRKLLAWLLVGVLLFGQRLTWFIRRDGLQGTLSTYFDWVGFVFLGLVSILVIMMLMRDLPILAARTMTWLKSLFVRRSKRPYFIQPDHGRRRFMLNASNAAIMAVTLPVSGYAVFEARRRPTIIHNDLPVHDLPEGLEGFTIAQISDTHSGPTIRQGWLQGVVEEVNKLGADMIVHTGDIVDGTVEALSEAVQPYADLSAPHGVWFVTGNHEYYSGVEPWIGKLHSLGMESLLNEHRLIDTGAGRLLLAGVTDLRGERIHPPHASSPAKAMEGAPDHDVSLLLAHQPRSIYDAAKTGFDIQLSGHTHGGQYFPYTMAIHLFQPYVRGLHLHENTLIYVSMGTGYWGPPMRLGTQPEVTLHTLKRA